MVVGLFTMNQVGKQATPYDVLVVLSQQICRQKDVTFLAPRSTCQLENFRREETCHSEDSKHN